MPLRHAPVVEWPAALAPLLQEAQITSSNDGKRVCRIDVDVDRQTLLALHEFEAHLRRRLCQQPGVAQERVDAASKTVKP